MTYNFKKNNFFHKISFNYRKPIYLRTYVNPPIPFILSYLALDKSSNRQSSSLRFCRTPIWAPSPGVDTAAEDILLPTGEILFGIDGKSWLLSADVRVFDPFNLVCSVTSTTFGDRCDVLFWAYVFDSLMPKSLLWERAPVHWKNLQQW